MKLMKGYNNYRKEEQWRRKQREKEQRKVPQLVVLLRF
jgi:hypothetical protein